MNERKAFTVETSKDLSEEFSSQCVSRGYTKYRAIEGAIRLWLTLNPEEQVALIEGKNTTLESDEDYEREIKSLIQRLGKLSKQYEENQQKASKAASQRKLKSG